LPQLCLAMENVVTDTQPDVQRMVEKAKESFGRDLLAPGYAQIISDADHLANILKLCEIVPGKSYLDIGTGSGYIAFELARQSPAVFVTGLDIVEHVVEVNNQKAQENNYRNLQFTVFEGTHFPFSDSAFYGAMSRYAFHHFPLPDLSVREIYRVLKPGGFCVIADPMANPADEVDFVNRFGALRDDGHVRYYHEHALIDLFTGAGFSVAGKFHSAITFPRPKDDRYERLLAHTAGRVLDLYQVRVEDEQITITVQVMNICFRKLAPEQLPITTKITKNTK
jgi:ubiquinone/menaquinone biosynthesis C-methylase UbiE